MNDYLEYAEVIPVLLVLEAALSRDGWTDEHYESYGEQLAEIGAERAAAGMRETAMDDARRIWDFQRRESALRRYAEAAPMHRAVCLEYIGGLSL
jgi:hypothetical protein